MPNVVKERWWWAVVLGGALASVAWAHHNITANSAAIVENRGRIQTTDRLLEMIRQENAESHRQIIDRLKGIP